MTNKRLHPGLKGPLLAGLFLLAPANAGEIDSDRLAQLPNADVVILGEVHDNPVHHENQTLAVVAIVPRALVFEMFGPIAALNATLEARRSPETLARALRWEEGGWPDFAMYYPIFIAAPDAAIFGGAVPRDDVRQAVSDGAAALFGAGAPLFGLDQPIGEAEQEAREASQQVAHCNALPERILPGMVEAQRLRDAALARAVIAAMAETGGPVVVITGNGHARKDWGMPQALALALPDVSVAVVGQLEVSPDSPPPFDYWLVTKAAEREDPCLAFQ
jgi:uncharacterized iron-regulated protein